jgi:hypothetical protein
MDPRPQQRFEDWVCDVNIVGITGSILPEDVNMFLSCVANVVLPKPLKISSPDKVWRGNGVLEQEGPPTT